MAHQHKSSKRDPRRIRKTPKSTPKYRHIIGYPATIFFPIESEIEKPTPAQLSQMAKAAIKPALDEYDDLDFELMPSWVDVTPFDPQKMNADSDDLIWIADTERVQTVYILELQSCDAVAPTVKEFASEEDARHGLHNYVKANYAIGLGEQPPVTLTAEQLIAAYYTATDEHYVLGKVDPDTETVTKFECSCGLEEKPAHHTPMRVN